MMDGILGAYVGIAAVGVFMGAMLFAIDDDLIPTLGTEGRVMLGILAGLLWPLIALYGVLWALRGAWRGVMQCVRLVWPAKVEVPKAKVRFR